MKVNDFLLINLYNANKESKQLNTLSTIFNILYNITELNSKNIILGGEFDIFFNLTYKARRGNPKMKNKSVAKFIQIKESLGLCDIWLVRIPRKNIIHSGNSMSLVSFKKRLDYFLVSNALQESINKWTFQPLYHQIIHPHSFQCLKV